MAQNSKKAGFTLIELIIILIIVGVLGAVTSRVIGETIQHRRFSASLSEMELLKAAIIGDPELKSAGVRTDFGFVGDVGRFPTSLRELVENYNLLPLWNVRTGIGWQGPYIERGFADDPDAYRQDAWGNFYTYSNTTGVITSPGSDSAAGGAGYAADFSTESLTSPLDRRYGTIRGVLTDVLGNPLIDTAATDVRVRIYYPFNGVEASRDAETLGHVAGDPPGVFHFTGIPIGNRRLRAIVGGTSFPLEKAVVISGVGSRHDLRIAADVTAPELPTAPVAEGIPFEHINLSWIPPTHNTDDTNLIDLAGFNIYRELTTPFTPSDANRIATVGLVRVFKDRAVSSHYIYHYIIRAFDEAGNESADSLIVSASTASGANNIRNVARATTHRGDDADHTLSVWIRKGADAFSEDPDAGENLVIEYLNSGWTWVELETFLGGPPFGTIYVRTYPLLSDALHSGFRVRFRQTGGSGTNYDYWHIDDVDVAGVFLDNFDDGSLGPDWTVSVTNRAGAGTHTSNSPLYSMFTMGGVVTVTSLAIDLPGFIAPPSPVGNFIILGIRNFSNTSITVTRVRVSWMGGGPTTYSGGSGIWTRIPTSADWVERDNDVTSNGAVAILDSPFTLAASGTANSEGVLSVGFNTEMPRGTAITIELNPHLTPPTATFDVYW